MNKPRDVEQRKPWYLLTGIILGVLFGLGYAWWVSPVEYVDTPPSSLRNDFKDQYRVLIALSYAVNGDLVKAKERLALLDVDDHNKPKDKATTIALSSNKLVAQAQQAVAEGKPETEAKALGMLAAALGQRPTPAPSLTSIQSSTPSLTPSDVSQATPIPDTEVPDTQVPTLSESESATPTPAERISSAELTPPVTKVNTEIAVIPSVTMTQGQSFIPLPSTTPSLTPAPSYVLKSKKLICDPGLKKPMIQIQVADASQKPITGVQVLINWQGGQDTFITGLKPDIGLGYADFSLIPKTVYSLRLMGSEELINDLKIEECETSRQERYGGTWLLTFAPP